MTQFHRHLIAAMTEDMKRGGGSRFEKRRGWFRTFTRYGTSNRQDGMGGRVTGTIAGTRHHKARLTDDDVRGIRRDVRAGVNRKDIHRRYKVSNSMVCNIIAGRAWSHVQ